MFLGVACATDAKKSPDDPVATQLKEIQDEAASQPGDARAQYALGNAYFDRRRYADARTAYLRATEIDPLYADAHSNLGLVYRIEGDLDSSIAQYEKALAIDPSDTVTRTNLIVALESAKRLPAAADQLAELSRRAPDDTAVLRQLGALLQQLDRPDEAETAYARLVATVATDKAAWFALGRCQHAQGKRDAAIASWKTTVALDPDHSEAHAALAGAYTEIGDYDRAWQSVRETQRIGGFIDPELVTRLQDLSGRTGPE